MLKQMALIVSLVVAATLTLVVPSFADTLWYNGDLGDNDGALLNTNNGTWGNCNMYDDFTVPAGGWTVNSVWSNNLVQFSNPTVYGGTISQAMWEIRSGVSSGNGGTLIAGGTSAATQTATGVVRWNLPEYAITVSGLDINLNPGRYWLTVAPVFFGPESGAAWISGTHGANAIGRPDGDTGSFFTSPEQGLGYNYAPVGQEGGYWPGYSSVDFSMGVGSGVAPEPASMILFSLGGAAIAWARRRKSA